jgi:hypothetical protein
MQTKGGGVEEKNRGRQVLIIDSDAAELVLRSNFVKSQDLTSSARLDKKQEKTHL